MTVFFVSPCIRGLLKDCCETREKSAWEQHAVLRTTLL